ncbi:uncharacterized protein LOC108045961 [Drosophila rhopaloa]|uniref:Uncharacterized protein LOC108045961 n=1 Tax=Drosophila rhopaloa TaxID=1041015 RepID=A0A6P4F6G6_DRORH|nr:uncharacterized protein LOC108045961 [Drosophila rhopaloa]
MDNLSGKLFGLFLFLQCVTEFHGVFIRFTNVTCESKDLSMSVVEYCELKTLGRTKNSISLRYTMLKPVSKNIGFHFQLMTKGSESVDGVSNWQPFLYAMDLDLCRFWKKRNNYVAKKIFELIQGHSNLNHCCPYSQEKFIAIDGLTNTDVSSKINGVPMTRGFYSLFTKWSTDNVTRFQTNFYFEVLNV